MGIVEVPDERLAQLSQLSGSKKLIPATIEFVDIAGLVKGASEGEGLGNKFLSHIRECNAIGHVVRIFDDPNIIHVHGKIDPKTDREVIESELLLSDVQTLEKRLDKARSDAKSGDKEKKKYQELLEMLMNHLLQGTLAVNIDLTDEERLQLRDLHLLSMKPSLYIINVPESELDGLDKAKYAEMLGLSDPNQIIPICAQLEQELSDLDEAEAQEYLQSLGMTGTGLNHLIRMAYDKLGLITFFTSGVQETHAWTVKLGSFAPQAAGTIHTDFEKGFIKAEVIHANDFIGEGGELKAKEKGLLRLEGKEYLVKDGDIMHFKFSP